MRLAVIPARGGSKRIPRKNIKNFCGKPIIAWSIEAAVESRCFDRIIVSTDDNEIAEVAKSYGAEIPFIRPAELSDDYTGTTSVVRHAIEFFSGQGIIFDEVCCIYATAPFIFADDLRKGLKKLRNCDGEQKVGYAFSVTSYQYPIQRAFKITENNRIEMFDPEYYGIRSQDLETAYHDAGQFYWGFSDFWREEIPLFTEFSVPVIIPRYRVQDIDTLEDWLKAEITFKLLEYEKKFY